MVREKVKGGIRRWNNTGYWYSKVACPECNEGRLAFAVRKDGRTHYLLCLNCGANYNEPPQPGDNNPAFDTPVEELNAPFCFGYHSRRSRATAGADLWLDSAVLTTLRRTLHRHLLDPLGRDICFLC